MSLLQDLQNNYRYGDCYVPDERYENYLRILKTQPLTRELVDYLCSRIDDPKGRKSYELRFIHLQPLFLNPTAADFGLKDYLYDHINSCRKLWLKLFFIRAYSLFAEESELIPIIQKFENSLRKNHDYQDYEPILSAAGLPYLCDKYGYACFQNALSTARAEYQKIDPLLRGFFTLNQDGNFLPLLPPEQAQSRIDQYLHNS